MPSRRSFRAGLVALACAGASLCAQAQPAWPTHAIRILAGSPPGGPSDITARIFGDALSRRVGQPVIVENRPGAGNNLAAMAAAKADDEGHTLVLSPDTVLTVNPHVYRTPGFDARTDLVNVSILANFSQMLVCHPKVGVATASELVAKAKSGRLTYASGGPGVPGHLAAEMFLQGTDVKMVHVPYKGPAPATQAVLAGEVDCGFLATPTVIPQVKAGKLRALAVSSATPSPLAPDVPTLASALKQPGLDATFHLVLQVASKAPPAAISALQAAAADIMKEPQVRARLQAIDLVAVGSSSAEAQQVMRSEVVKWEPIVRKLDLKAD